MNKFWKWILGIVIVLVVLFVLGVGARLLLANLLPGADGIADGFRHPMMGTRLLSRMHPFGGFMRLGGLLPLLLVGLLAFGAYWLGKRQNVTTQAPLAQPAKCANCSQPVQPGWNNCPNCGEKIR